MKRLLLIVLIVCHGFATAAYAQQRIDISGAWDFAMGDSTQYNDYVMLPGIGVNAIIRVDHLFGNNNALHLASLVDKKLVVVFGP